MKKAIELLEDALESVYVDFGFDQSPKRDCKCERELLKARPGSTAAARARAGRMERQCIFTTNVLMATGEYAAI
jgi:hypothetical protein